LLAAVLLTAAAASNAASWILPVDHLNGSFTEIPGGGYYGASAYDGNGIDGVRRVYWSLQNTLSGSVPTGVHLYSIRVFVPTSGGTDWQPIESQFNGIIGETYPIEPGIPWNGLYGTNHEYIGSDAFTPGSWQATGPGPHTPETADQAAGGNGTLMWLKDTSWLYAKWDFGWPIHRSWSAIEITQVDQVPEPASLMAGAGLLLGLITCAVRRRR
jgi:hypothetical protein